MTHYKNASKIKPQFVPVEDRINHLLNIVTLLFITVLFLLCIFGFGIIQMQPFIEKIDNKIVAIEILKNEIRDDVITLMMLKDDVRNIDEALQIFKKAVVRDADRQKRLKGEFDGNFYELESGAEEGE